MRGLVIGVVTFAAVFVLEAIVTTMRYFGDRKEDELKRRLQQLGTTESVKFGLSRQGRLAAVSGKMVKQSPESMKIRTPSAIMGVRGTEFVVQVDEPKR